jgi:hypothetical protein
MAVAEERAAFRPRRLEVRGWTVAAAPVLAHVP